MQQVTIFSGRFLEALSGFQFIVDGGMVIFFGAYLSRAVKWKRPLGWTNIWSSPSLKIGWSLMIFALGDTINRGIVWWSRHDENFYNIAPWSSTYTQIAAIAALIASWGGLCALRVATPGDQGEKPWLTVLFVAMAFSAVTAYGDVVFGWGIR